MPCIAAILFQVAYNMSGWRVMVDTVKHSPKSDAAVLLLTFLPDLLSGGSDKGQGKHIRQDSQKA